MKKRLIALPLVAGVGAAAFAGTSQYAGNQTQTAYQQILARLNGLSPLVFVNETYESGLRKSTAVTKVLASQSADAEVLFRLHHDIEHAAVRMADDGVKLGQVSVDTALHDKSTLAPEILAVFKQSEPFLLSTEVSYTGDIRNTLNVSVMEMTGDGLELSWSGLSFEGTTQNASTVGSGSMGTLSFNDVASGGRLSVASSPFNVDLEDHGDNIYTGTADFSFNTVEMQSPELPVPISLASVVIDTDTNLESDSVNSASRISATGIESPLPLKEASLLVDIAGLDVEGLRQYNSFMGSLGSDPDAMIADPEHLSKMTAAFRSIVKPGSAMKFALSLANDDGDVNADIRVGIKDESEEGMSADALENVVTGRDLLNVLSVKGALDADTQALAQTPVLMMLGGVGEFVTVTDESITSDISLEGSTLVVNGVELPLDVMSGGMLDVPLSDLTQM